MARKRTPAAPPPPTPERVMAALRAGEYPAAVRTAHRLYESSPSPENLGVLKATLLDAGWHFADRDKMDEFIEVAADVAKLDPDNPAWVAEWAALLARAGMAEDGLKLLERTPDPAAGRPKVLALAADRAVRRRSKERLPEELHAGLDAVLAAFRHHEAGNEAAAREALEPIGLRSPFLEWKVLLRGLLAHAAGDDARAAENFARLDPARLPARLAAPLRVGIDPAHRASLPPDIATPLLTKHQKLTSGPLVEGLRAIARELGRDKPLGPAFKAAEAVVPLLKQTAPHLVPRLANCLYAAIGHQGQPDDLPRFRRLFGNPPDDPHFDKLQAVVRSAVGDRTGAHAHWQKFEQWLTANPPGWPPPLVTRARAEVWARMGENAQAAAEEPELERLGLFTIVRRDRTPKPLSPPADACFRRAVELAPEWPEAARHLFESLVEAKKPAEAEAAARTFLARRPDNLPAVEALANLLQSQGRTPEAAELWVKALALNPLDKTTRLRAALALVGTARRRLIDGDPAAAEAVLEENRPLLDDQSPATAAALRAVTAVKLRKPDEAAALRAKALAPAGARLGAAYRMMVDSQLAKLKPAERKAADALFAEELAKPPTPLEVNQLIGAYDLYHIEGFVFRGQKAHEKKVLDAVPRVLAADAPEVDFERLGDLLVMKHEWKAAKKYVEGCRDRFPRNPVFLVQAAEVIVGRDERLYSADRLLVQAKKLAEASAEPRHRALLDRIAKLQKEIDTPPDFADLFDAFD